MLASTLEANREAKIRKNLILLISKFRFSLIMARVCRKLFGATKCFRHMDVVGYIDVF